MRRGVLRDRGIWKLGNERTLDIDCLRPTRDVRRNGQYGGHRPRRHRDRFVVLGRFPITKEADTAAFKTPEIRNVLVTRPYFHDGSQRRSGTLSTMQPGRRSTELLSRRRHPPARLDRAGNRRPRLLHGIADELAVPRTWSQRAGSAAQDRAHNQPASTRHCTGLRSKTAAARAARSLITGSARR